VTVTGRVVRAPFGFGAFVLEADDGARYALAGGAPELLEDGRRAAVRGELASDLAGVGMTGDPVLRVEGYTLLDDQ